MFNIGTGEMIMIAVVALLVLGPQRLPELSRGIGKFLREFRRQTDDVRNVVEREFYRMDNDINAPAPQPAPGELALTPAPVDESDPGHPDHFREETPPADAATPAEAAPPEKKVG